MRSRTLARSIRSDCIAIRSRSRPVTTPPERSQGKTTATASWAPFPREFAVVFGRSFQRCRHRHSNRPAYRPNEPGEPFPGESTVCTAGKISATAAAASCVRPSAEAGRSGGRVKGDPRRRTPKTNGRHRPDTGAPSGMRAIRREACVPIPRRRAYLCRGAAGRQGQKDRKRVHWCLSLVV